MPLSATVTAAPTPLLINQTCTVNIIISNSTAAPINILSVTPFVTFTGDTYSVPSVALGVVNLGPGANVTVPAVGGGVLGLVFNINFFAPSTGPIGAGPGTYSVTCSISASDGQVITPTAAIVTVNPLPLPVSEQ
jgi:hypothetical protein